MDLCVSHSNKHSEELHATGGVTLQWGFIVYGPILPF